MAVFLAVLLFPTVLGDTLTPQPEPTPVFITAPHQAGLILYDRSPRNTSAAFNSDLLGFGSVSVHIIGLNVTYNLTVQGSNLTRRGVTNQSETVFTITPNGSQVWPIVTLGTGANATTYNFGIISFRAEPVTIKTTPEALSILVVEALKRELWTLIYAGAVMVSFVFAFYH